MNPLPTPLTLSATEMVVYLLEKGLVANVTDALAVAQQAPVWVPQEVPTWLFDVFRLEEKELPPLMPVLITQQHQFYKWKVLAGTEYVAERKRQGESLIWAYVGKQREE